MTGGRLAVAALLAGCAVPQPAGRSGGPAARSAAVLAARPGGAAGEPPTPGEHLLGLRAERDALLYVPPGPPSVPAPLLVSLHGAGGDAAAGLALLRSWADERGLVILAPASRGSTWDAVRGGYGDDAELIDRALADVFSTVAVDAERVAVAGFSDGASYALGLGLANGDLFRRILAFSPGFIPAGPRAGSPAVFVSHGEADGVLPIERTSRRIVPALEGDGYDVTYREFPGGHAVPPEIVRAALDWLGRGHPR